MEDAILHASCAISNFEREEIQSEIGWWRWLLDPRNFAEADERKPALKTRS